MDSMEEVKHPWCVRHRDGWCRVKGNQRFADAATNIETRCGLFVVLPWGCERREPTCRDCQPQQDK